MHRSVMACFPQPRCPRAPRSRRCQSRLSTAEWLVIHLAAVRIGAVTNPLIAIYRDRVVGYMMKRAGSKLLVVPQQFRKFDYPAMVRRLAPELPALERVLVVGADPASGNDDGFLSWETFMDTPWEERREPAGLEHQREDDARDDL